MKKVIIACVLALMGSMNALAQKYALIDMDYILSQIPQYEMANEQLEQISHRWQAEVESKDAEAQQLYKQYQADQVFLTPEQKEERQNAILAKEQEVQMLRTKYFGPDGELFQKRNSLVGHIQDDIYEAVKEIAEKNNFVMVIDRASAESIIYASPKIDISKEVLKKMGY